MVLSNKKPKQKIREDLVKSLSVSVAETNPDSVSNLQSQSLKELLDSASHKPRFSKREKGRKTETCPREDQPVDEIREKTDKKKRKRDEEEGTKERENPKKKNKKKKKKKKRKANKTPKKDNVEDKVKVEEIQVNTELKEEEEDGVVLTSYMLGVFLIRVQKMRFLVTLEAVESSQKLIARCVLRMGLSLELPSSLSKLKMAPNGQLAFDRAAMGDRFLTIQQYLKTTPSIPRRNASSGFAPEMVDGYNRVYVGNLAWDTTEHDIRKIFSDCVINSVRLGKNKETGEFKGYAHVDFKDSVSVAIALKLDQQVICGRPVKICCALKERPATDPTPDETNNAGSYNMEETLTVPNEGNYFTPTVSTGKIKRRVCYECGEKGHLSTACPKKLQNADDQANSKFGQETIDAGLAKHSYGLQKNSGDSYYMNERYAATDEANNGSLASAVSTGKIKRRSCYECGEKGHLSTACPKKLQNTAHSNQKLDHQTDEAIPIQVKSYSLENRTRDTENNGVSYMDETYATGLLSADVTNEANDGNLASTVSTGKIKRRNCYECGEKGHLSSACPKKHQKQG